MTFHQLRHVNASVMDMLNIPESYRMERGGWKSDKVMKRVYTHTFSEGRKEADKKVDEFFGNVIKGSSIVSNSSRVKSGFDYSGLLSLGYTLLPMEGGYMSPNAATIIYQKGEHAGEVLPFVQGREDQHNNNIKILEKLEFLE